MGIKSMTILTSNNFLFAKHNEYLTQNQLLSVGLEIGVSTISLLRRPRLKNAIVPQPT